MNGTHFGKGIKLGITPFTSGFATTSGAHRNVRTSYASTQERTEHARWSRNQNSFSGRSYTGKSMSTTEQTLSNYVVHVTKNMTQKLKKSATKRVKAWVLVHGGSFIAAFRHRPKRVYQGKKGEGFYAWTDCNGPMQHPRLKGYSANAIEGSMNATCHEVTITYTLPTNKQ